MMARIASALVASTLLLSASAARADTAYDGGGEALGLLYLATQVTAVGCGLYDVVARPRSKGYALLELGTGLTAGAVSLGLAASIAEDGDEGGTWLFVGLAAIDLGVAAHGVWLLGRSEPPAVEIGTLRGRVAPTVVSDGVGVLPAMGFSGTF